MMVAGGDGIEIVAFFVVARTLALRRSFSSLRNRYERIAVDWGNRIAAN